MDSPCSVCTLVWLLPEAQLHLFATLGKVHTLHGASGFLGEELRGWPRMTGSDLHRGDSALLQALLRGDSHVQAARACGLSERTVRRRLADDSFREALTSARRETLRRTADALGEAGLDAVRTLRLLVTEPRTPASVRRAAARDLLDLSMRVREQLDLVERVEDLEQLLRGSG